MLEFAPYTYEFHEDAYPLYRQLRKEVPFYSHGEMGFGAALTELPIVIGERG